MKIAGYVRCSTNKQDLEGQIQSLKDWGAKFGHEVTVYKDYAIKGITTNREGIDRLLADCSHGLYEGVATWEISRLGRSISQIHWFVEALAKSKINIILCNSNTTLDYSTLEGRALIGGLALAADIEYVLICERNKRGRETIKRNKVKCGRKFSEELGVSAEAVVNFKNQGKSFAEIAKLLNTCKSTAFNVWRRASKVPQMHVQEST